MLIFILPDNSIFVFGPPACLLVFVYWINPVYVERLDCLCSFDPLPEFTFLFYESPFNKLLLMDSTSAASLQATDTIIVSIKTNSIPIITIQFCIVFWAGFYCFFSRATAVYLHLYLCQLFLSYCSELLFIIRHILTIHI